MTAPKRPLSPFIFFSQEARKEIKKDNPNFNSKQVMKQVQRRWQSLTKEEQGRYRCQSNLNRAEYETKKRKFEEQRAVHLRDTVPGASMLETIKHRRLKQNQREIDQPKKTVDQKIANTDTKIAFLTKYRSKSHENNGVAFDVKSVTNEQSTRPKSQPCPRIVDVSLQSMTPPQLISQKRDECHFGQVENFNNAPVLSKQTDSLTLVIKRKRGRPRKTDKQHQEGSSEVNRLKGLRMEKANEKSLKSAAKPVQEI